MSTCDREMSGISLPPVTNVHKRVVWYWSSVSWSYSMLWHTVVRPRSLRRSACNRSRPLETADQLYKNSRHDASLELGEAPYLRALNTSSDSPRMYGLRDRDVITFAPPTSSPGSSAGRQLQTGATRLHAIHVVQTTSSMDRSLIVLRIGLLPACLESRDSLFDKALSVKPYKSSIRRFIPWSRKVQEPCKDGRMTRRNEPSGGHGLIRSSYKQARRRAPCP